MRSRHRSPILFVLIFCSLQAVLCVEAEGRFQKLFMMMGGQRKQGTAGEPQGYDDSSTMTSKTCGDPGALQDTVKRLNRVQAERDRALTETIASANQVQKLQNELEKLKTKNKKNAEILSKAADAAIASRDQAIRERDAAVRDLQNANRQRGPGGADAAAKVLKTELDHEKQRLSKMEREKELLTAELSALKHKQKLLEGEHNELKLKLADAQAADMEARMEEEVFKKLAHEMKAIQEQAEAKWKAKIDELTETHNSALEENDRKIEMVKIGTRKIGQDQLKQAEEKHALELKKMTASHKVEVQVLRKELVAGYEEKLRTEKAVSFIVSETAVTDANSPIPFI